MNSQIFSEIMRDYDLARQSAQRLLNSRRREIYDAIPRLEEIDNALSRTGAALMRAALTNSGIEDLRQKNTELMEEKENLLANSPFPSDYLTNIYNCSLCHDTGYVNNEKCSCLKQKLLERYYAISNLKATLKDESFAAFNINYYSDKKWPSEGASPRNMMLATCRFCLDFVKDFNIIFSNLLFYGGVGLGKTFLCNCIAGEILEKGHTVLYNTAGNLFQTVEDARFNKEDDPQAARKIKFFYSADLLIIDDLGTEFDTLATQAALFNIINTRLLDKKPTIISTNLDIRQLKDKYTERIISRLEGNYRFCKFFGDDIRVIKKLSPPKNP